MTKRLLITLLIGAAASTFAASPYLSLKGGLSKAHNSDYTVSSGFPGRFDYDSGYNLGGAIGLNFHTGESTNSAVGYRVELALDYQANDLAHYKIASGKYSAQGDLSAFSGFANGYLDYYLSEKWSIYGMIGLGLTDFTFDDSDIKYSDTVGAAQIGLGTGVELTQHVILDLSYTYQMFEDMDFSVGRGRSVEMENSASKFQMGLRYQF